jgi:hypothetical protein
MHLRLRRACVTAPSRSPGPGKGWENWREVALQGVGIEGEGAHEMGRVFEAFPFTWVRSASCRVEYYPFTNNKPSKSKCCSAHATSSSMPGQTTLDFVVDGPKDRSWKLTSRISHFLSNHFSFRMTSMHLHGHDQTHRPGFEDRRSCPAAGTVSIENMLRAGPSRVRTSPEAKHFSLLYVAHTRREAHPAFYSIRIKVISEAIKRPGSDADHTPPSNAEVKNKKSHIFTAPSAYMSSSVDTDNF